MSSGTLVDLANPTPDMIKYEDILFSLSYVNRYTGHAGPYSVIQHSKFVMDLLPEELKPYGGAHDFHETYVNDISSPVKRLFRHMVGADWGYERVVSLFDVAIHDTFGLEFPLSAAAKKEVVRADLTALATEMVQLFPANPRDAEFMSGLPKPVDVEIPTLTADEARKQFDTEFQRVLKTLH